MMRFTRRSSIAALAVLIGLSLSSAPPASGASVGIGGATIDGKSWSADRSLAVPSAIGAKPILNVNLFAGTNPLSRFGFNLGLTKAGAYVGSYEVAPRAKSTGLFTPDQLNPDIMANNFQFTGTLTITAYDAAKGAISGTFSGVAANHEGTKTLKIENGSFNDVGVSAGK